MTDPFRRAQITLSDAERTPTIPAPPADSIAYAEWCEAQRYLASMSPDERRMMLDLMRRMVER